MNNNTKKNQIMSYFNFALLAVILLSIQIVGLQANAQSSAQQASTSSEIKGLSKADAEKLADMARNLQHENVENFLKKIQDFLRIKLGEHNVKSDLATNRYGRILAVGYFSCPDFYLKKYESLSANFLRIAAKEKIVSAFADIWLNSPRQYKAEYENFIYNHVDDLISATKTNSLDIIRSVGYTIYNFSFLQNNNQKIHETSDFKRFMTKFLSSLDRNSAVRVSRFFNNKYLMNIIGKENITQMLIYFPHLKLEDKEIPNYYLFANFNPGDEQIQRILSSWQSSASDKYRNLVKLYLAHFSGDAQNTKKIALEMLLDKNETHYTDVAPYYYILGFYPLESSELQKIFDKKIIFDDEPVSCIDNFIFLISGLNFWNEKATNEYKLSVIKTILEYGEKRKEADVNFVEDVGALSTIINKESKNKNKELIEIYLREKLAKHYSVDAKESILKSVKTHYSVLSKALSSNFTLIEIRSLFIDILKQNSQDPNNAVEFVLNSLDIAEPNGQDEFVKEMITVLSTNYNKSPWNKTFIDQKIEKLNEYLK